jgi:hypothetical protein
VLLGPEVAGLLLLESAQDAALLERVCEAAVAGSCCSRSGCACVRRCVNPLWRTKQR